MNGWFFADFVPCHSLNSTLTALYTNGIYGKIGADKNTLGSRWGHTTPQCHNELELRL